MSEYTRVVTKVKKELKKRMVAQGYKNNKSLDLLIDIFVHQDLKERYAR